MQISARSRKKIIFYRENKADTCFHLGRQRKGGLVSAPFVLDKNSGRLVTCTANGTANAPFILFASLSRKRLIKLSMRLPVCTVLLGVRKYRRTRKMSET